MTERARNAAVRFMYLHTSEIGYRVPCPDCMRSETVGCATCRDTRLIGFFRAQRMKKGRG